MCRPFVDICWLSICSLIFLFFVVMEIFGQGLFYFPCKYIKQVTAPLEVEKCGDYLIKKLTCCSRRRECYGVFVMLPLIVIILYMRI